MQDSLPYSKEQMNNAMRVQQGQLSLDHNNVHVADRSKSGECKQALVRWSTPPEKKKLLNTRKFVFSYAKLMKSVFRSARPAIFQGARLKGNQC